MDVDDMLIEAGGFGRYQWLLVALFSLVNILSAFHYFSQTFISLVPEHWCPQHNSSQQLGCPGGWHFDYNATFGFHTAVSEFGWVGKQSWKPVAGQSFFFLGSVLGTLVLGVMADHVGRLPVLIFSNILALLGNLATAFTTDLLQFSAARFAAGSATDTNFVMMYIIVMEYMPPRLRTAGLNLSIGLFYCLGSAAVPWVAVMCGNWRTFLLAVSAPLAVVPVYWLILPESARWLINKGRLQEAIACFQRVAKFNGNIIPSASVNSFMKTWACKKTTDKNPNLLGLFATSHLRRKMFILIFKSVVLTVCYDAISRNVSHHGLSPMLVFTISSATILPSCCFILALQDTVGRKGLASASLLATGVFTMTAGAILIPQHHKATGSGDGWLAVVLCVAGRFWVNIAYNSGAQYAAELIPTVVRGQGVAAIHVAGYAATFFSPYILHMAYYWKPAPQLVLGAMSAIGAALCLFLPETTGKTLPHSLQDGEQFGKGEHVCLALPPVTSTRRKTEPPELGRGSINPTVTGVVMNT